MQYLKGSLVLWLVSAILTPAYAQSVPQLPGDFTTQIASSSTAVIAALSPYTELILGVLLAALVLGILIGALRGRH